MPTLYFGQHWDVPRLEGATQVPTPVGEPCLWCDEPIEEGDRGIQMLQANEPLLALLQDFPSTAFRPIHRECDLRQFLGGIAHLSHKCECYGHDSDKFEEELGLSKRQEAIAVWDWVSERGARPVEGS
jgi:hypothetical protein